MSPLLPDMLLPKLSSCDLRFVACTLEPYNLQTIPSEAKLKTRNESNFLGSYTVHALCFSRPILEWRKMLLSGVVLIYILSLLEWMHNPPKM